MSDEVVSDESRAIVAAGNDLLLQEVRELREIVMEDRTSRSLEYEHMVKKVTGEYMELLKTSLAREYSERAEKKEAEARELAGIVAWFMEQFGLRYSPKGISVDANVVRILETSPDLQMVDSVSMENVRKAMEYIHQYDPMRADSIAGSDDDGDEGIFR